MPGAILLNHVDLSRGNASLPPTKRSYEGAAIRAQLSAADALDHHALPRTSECAWAQKVVAELEALGLKVTISTAA